MRVELSIRNDKELRNHIRDCIRGEVTKIAREEIKQTVVSELMRKIQSNNEAWFEMVMRQEMRSFVEDWFKLRYESTDKFLPIALEEVRYMLKEFTIPRVNKQFEKLSVTNAKINKIVEGVIRDKILKAMNLAPTGKYIVTKKSFP